MPRVCSRFSASRVAARNGLRLGAGRREWSFPCQVLQRQRRSFPAQPEGPGQFLCDAALLDGSFGPPNFASRALPRAKTGSGAAVRETGTDPNLPQADHCGPDPGPGRSDRAPAA
ncbi:hypothetical protein DNK06_20670 [Pseudomonas daroniae]|uniref:Uncharacterized protein n=1 Tax=Phytopseudomonas daroniae TaxID=2487519 RepID=A0A4Q9QGQ9_9GAMM|nr:hypothetical protein DNK06_20670 [Pseudomonas daroniae]TBU79182.1 hypothetical protein DNK31_19920 [Pseudomonas sp. FRB 228]TBU88080.1 hypothetical protein DNJ99_20145 [Pseudomonas daroniae]